MKNKQRPSLKKSIHKTGRYWTLSRVLQIARILIETYRTMHKRIAQIQLLRILPYKWHSILALKVENIRHNIKISGIKIK